MLKLNIFLWPTAERQLSVITHQQEEIDSIGPEKYLPCITSENIFKKVKNVDAAGVMGYERDAAQMNRNRNQAVTKFRPRIGPF